MRKFLAGALLAAFLAGSSQGAFFSNIPDGSAEASASALESISQVFRGLAALERNDQGGSEEAFSAALDLIAKAIESFDQLAMQDFASTPVLVSDLEAGHREMLIALKLEPATIGEVLTATADALRDLQGSIATFIETKDLATYSAFRQQITRVLSVGEIGTQLASEALNR